MENKFKIGDIVREGTFISSIKKIENGKAILAKNYEVKLERLSQVEINGGFDAGIVLDSKIPVRAPIVASGERIPIRKTISYLESSIDGKTIASIVEENNFTIVSELQDWMSQNSPDFFLRARIYN